MVVKLQIKSLLLAGLLCILAAGPLAAQAGRDTSILLSPNLQEVSVDSFFLYISKYTGFRAIYPTTLIRHIRPITYRQQQVPLYKILDTVLGSQGLRYRIFSDFIILHRDERALVRNTIDTLQGKVTGEKGKPLSGVSVRNKEKGLCAITSHEGIFQLPWPDGSGCLELSHIAYEIKRLHINKADTLLRIALKPSFEELQEVTTTHYMPSWYHVTTPGTWSKVNYMGAIYRISGDELQRSSLHSNPVSALSGRVPGLIVTPTSGALGAMVNIHIRGPQSIGTLPGRDNLPQNSPLILLNGIPLITGNNPVTQLPSIAGDPQGGAAASGISVLNAINAADVESIEILKDADATALYGAQGANGVISFTTRTGRQGRPRFHINLQSGAATSTRLPSLLNNREYTAMRKEALAAAGMQPTATNAPDLFLLDTNNYINLPKLMAGGTGRLINANISLQGGDSLLQYYISGSGYRETSVLPISLPQQRLTSYVHLRYRSPDRRWQAALFLHNSYLHYSSIAADPMYSTRLVPLLPDLRDANGQLVWEHNGFFFINPLGQFATSNNTRIHTTNASLQIEYQLRKNLRLRTTLGYQWLPVEEQLKIPIESRHPAEDPVGEAAIAHSQYKGYMAEPQLEYEHTGKNWKGRALLGVAFREERRKGNIRWDRGYANDGVPDQPGAAAATTEQEYAASYSYRSLYSRFNMDWRHRYYLNATGRLDASSRLGPSQRLTFFGALGAAWVFSKEKWMPHWPWLTLGKLRTSYGTTGNDHLDNDKYFDTWSRQSGLQPYDGSAASYPKQQAVLPLSWEKSRKGEVALELYMANKFSFQVAWYRNTTTNQFIAEQIPGQPGPNNYRIVNWPAKILNTGWEFTGQATHQWAQTNSYTSTLTLTLPRNRLLAFPGIASTAYNNLIVGQPLSARRLFQSAGVDAHTGLFSVPASPGTVIANQGQPQAYAGWSQEWRLGQFRISLLLEARKQKAFSSLYYTYTGVAPGNWSSSQLTNQPRIVLQRWQQPGDQAPLQRFTAANTPDVQEAIQFFRQSEAMIVDASFWRIRSLFLSWNWPENWCRSVKISKGNIYLQAENLFTGTPYRDGDPTILYPLKLPSLRTITAGLQIDF